MLIETLSLLLATAIFASLEPTATQRREAEFHPRVRRSRRSSLPLLDFG